MKSVLLVDSDEASRRRLQKDLSRYDDEFRLLVAANGREATRLFADTTIHLLITSLEMPVMDGYELLAHALHSQPTLEVIVLGDTPSGRVRTALTSYGAFRYYEKPVRSEALLEEIRRVASQPVRGPISGLSLPGLLQLLNSERSSCSLQVRSRGRIGRIEVRDGEVVDASCERHRGRRAFYEILAWREPRIESEESAGASERTIQLPLAPEPVNPCETLGIA